MESDILLNCHYMLFLSFSPSMVNKKVGLSSQIEEEPTLHQ